MRCHRCNEPMTLFVVGDDYCPPCKREIKVRDEQDAKRTEATRRFGFAKDLGRSPAA